VEFTRKASWNETIFPYKPETALLITFTDLSIRFSSSSCSFFWSSYWYRDHGGLRVLFWVYWSLPWSFALSETGSTAQKSRKNNRLLITKQPPRNRRLQSVEKVQRKVKISEEATQWIREMYKGREETKITGGQISPNDCYHLHHYIKTISKIIMINFHYMKTRMNITSCGHTKIYGLLDDTKLRAVQLQTHLLINSSFQNFRSLIYLVWFIFCLENMNRVK